MPYGLVVAVFVMLLLFVYGFDPVWLYVFLVLPAVFLAILLMLGVLAVSKRKRQSLSVLLAVVTFLFTSGAMLKTKDVLRPSLRWLLWSNRLKAEVLAQPAPAHGEFKHLEWDGWGGMPVGDWTVYVVYDPTDSLSVAAKGDANRMDNRLEGIPCTVDSVRRLESHWYSVGLGMNEWWDRCG
jgi:hypothetical protein